MDVSSDPITLREATLGKSEEGPSGQMRTQSINGVRNDVQMSLKSPPGLHRTDHVRILRRKTERWGQTTFTALTKETATAPSACCHHPAMHGPVTHAEVSVPRASRQCEVVESPTGPCASLDA
jgi:hypothetical protein